MIRRNMGDDKILLSFGIYYCAVEGDPYLAARDLRFELPQALGRGVFALYVAGQNWSSEVFLLACPK